MGPTKSSRRAVALAWVVGLLLLASAPGAAAHTGLVASSPTAQERVDRVPGHVVLEFAQPVTAADGSVRVLDSRGTERARHVLVSHTGRVVSVVLGTGGALGRWTVDYRVRGEDGHDVSGGLAFAVVTGSAAGAGPTLHPVTAGAVTAVAALVAFAALAAGVRTAA